MPDSSIAWCAECKEWHYGIICPCKGGRGEKLPGGFKTWYDRKRAEVINGTNITLDQSKEVPNQSKPLRSKRKRK